VLAYRAAFLDHRLDAMTQADSGLNRRERGELMAALGRSV
jgi:hypothetical protein